MRNILIVAVALLFFTTAFAEEKLYKMITASELQQLQQTEKTLVVIDTRSEKYMEDGVVIKGAKRLAAKETDEESLAKIVPTTETPIVFYCSNMNCPASSIAAVKAAHAGYRTIYKFAGGIEAWKAQGLPTEMVAK